MEQVRNVIAGEVRKLVGASADEPGFARPPGDPGLFDQGSPVWRVNGDFTTMMIGGVAALYLQMLHPVALAGVWDHSNFRADMLGRLRRTARFVAGTTYGSTAHAEQLIGHVRAIHDRVGGTLPDGSAYTANDPAVLTWVHVAGAHSFLGAYLRYSDPWLPRRDQDRYYADMATVAERLGASRIPRSSSAVAAYLQAMRPELRVDARTRTVARALRDQPAPSAALAPFGKLTMQAAIDLMPAWARGLHGFQSPSLGAPIVRAGATGAGLLLRWALRPARN